MFGPLVLTPQLQERTSLQQTQGAAKPLHMWPGDSAREMAHNFDQLLDRVIRAGQIPVSTAPPMPHVEPGPVQTDTVFTGPTTDQQWQWGQPQPQQAPPQQPQWQQPPSAPQPQPQPQPQWQQPASQPLPQPQQPLPQQQAQQPQWQPQPQQPQQPQPQWQHGQPLPGPWQQAPQQPHQQAPQPPVQPSQQHPAPWEQQDASQEQPLRRPRRRADRPADDEQSGEIPQAGQPGTSGEGSQGDSQEQQGFPFQF